ncbi:hypothetical protein BCD64_05160 [Nostoc sp. MBR 210]|nr:hypothetical protein BCD64_05160 [Nostoc sp. MBR 210]
MYGCLLGKIQRKVSCWEDGLVKKTLKIFTAGGIAFLKLIATKIADNIKQIRLISTFPIPAIKFKLGAENCKERKF